VRQSERDPLTMGKPLRSGDPASKRHEAGFGDLASDFWTFVTNEGKLLKMQRKSRKAALVETQEKITLAGKTVTYAVRTSLKAKRIRLELRPDRGLVLVVPRRHSIERARSFLREKSHWILLNLAKYDEARRRPTRDTSGAANANGPRDGDTVPYLGHDLVLSVHRRGNAGRSVTMNDGRLTVGLPGGQDGLRPALEAWYRAQAETIIRRKVDELAARQGARYNRCVLRSQKTLWGSCSRKRNLNFNWKLIMAPEAVIDYVIIHELAHLREMNHSARFWAIVAKECPEYRERRKWLKQRALESQWWAAHNTFQMRLAL